MANFTVRIPEDRYRRLKQLAETRKTSLNSLFEKMATVMLTEYDVQTRLELRQKRGNAKGLIEALDALDRLENRKQKELDLTVKPKAKPRRELPEGRRVLRLKWATL
jgi:predicted transcriptional regulator